MKFQKTICFHISVNLIFKNKPISILTNELIVSEELTNGQISDKIICKNY
jgi:hypothetical protein